MTDSGDLRSLVEELAKEFANRTDEYPDDHPMFQNGVEWGFRIAHYRLKNILDQT